MLRFIPNRPRRSLEIGCREGLFSKLLKESLGVEETWGVEPDGATLVESARSMDRVIHDMFPPATTELPRGYFDLAVFNDVLEHMYNPWEALEACRPLLTPGGCVVASIPNVRHKPILKDLILRDEFRYQEAGNLDISHIRFFTRKSMLRLFEETGYEVLRLEPVKPVTDPFKRLVIFLTWGFWESFYAHQYALVARVRQEK